MEIVSELFQVDIGQVVMGFQYTLGNHNLVDL